MSNDPIMNINQFPSVQIPSSNAEISRRPAPEEIQPDKPEVSDQFAGTKQNQEKLDLIPADVTKSLAGKPAETPPETLHAAIKDSRAGDEEVKDITIIYTNDLHGKINAWNGVGGVENLSGVINDLRERNPRSVLLDAGDIAYNPPFSEDHNFTPMNTVMNKLGYNGMGLGNHEFQNEADQFGGVYGNPTEYVDNIHELSQAVNFPLINCNAVLAADGKTPDFIKPYVIYDLGGVKLGVTSVVTDRLTTENHPLVGENWEIENPTVSLNKIIPEMKKAGADIIGVLSHHNLSYSRKIANRTHGVDFMIASHDHKTTQKPIIVKNADGKDTPIAEAGSMGSFVGDMLISVDPKTKRKTGFKNTLYKVSESSHKTADKEVIDIVNKWASQMPKVNQYEDREPSHHYRLNKETGKYFDTDKKGR